MLDHAGFRALNGLWLLSQRSAHRTFRAALRRPAEAQAARLRTLLACNATSEYGRRYGFARLRTFADYQDAVPIVGWDELVPWIHRIRAGRPGVLTAEPVLIFETTGGSTGGAKYIPYTRGLLEEFRQALGAWMCDLYDARPALRAGGAYWSLSPLARARDVTPGGIPVGFDADVEYFGTLQRRLLRHLLLTPPELAAVDDVAASRYVTLRFLVGSPEVSFISVWNPSFLTLLADALQAWTPGLIDDVERGTVTPPAPLSPTVAWRLARRLTPDTRRARGLRRLAGRAGALRPTDVWPRLAVISCWTSAAARRVFPELQARFPGVEVQGKGLLATEGVVSIPLVGHPGGAVAVTSHVYEFAALDERGRRLRLVHELEPGRRYAVILTTGGGLYRYALGDVVEVVGTVGATPLVEFVGRAGAASDLCGEKLVEGHVAAAVDAAVAALGLRSTFVLLAPEPGPPPHYALFVQAHGAPDSALARLAREVDARLDENPAYAYCRRLGQLGAVRAFRVAGDGAAAYLDRRAALGQRAGSVKPSVLDRTAGWSAHLPGALV